MGLEFLGRIRQTSLWSTAVASLFAAVYVSYAHGIGLAAGACWSLANLWLLERIVVAVVRPGQRSGAALRRAGLAGLANVALLAFGAVLLQRLPAVPLVIGFTLPFAVLTLKAMSRALLDSALWQRFTASRWTAAVALATVVALAWFALGAATRAETGTAAHGAATVEAHGEHAAEGAAAPGEAHGDAAAHGEGGHGEAAAAGPKKFDTALSWLIKANHGKPWADFLHHYEIVVFSLLVAVLISLVAFLAMRNATLIPRPFQNVVEALVEAVYTQIVDILGPKYGPRYVPFLGSLFLYILFMNLFGILPLMESPTSNLNVTVALALTVFVYVQFTAIKELGPLGWLDHLAGNPRSAIEWGLVPLMLPIHVIGELAKPVSLSCRLFGNIFGEDMLLVGFATLGIGLFATLGLGALPFGLPLHFPFLFLALLTSFVQALVFSMLSTIYFLLMLPHDHGHGHEAEAHHAH